MMGEPSKKKKKKKKKILLKKIMHIQFKIGTNI